MKNQRVGGAEKAREAEREEEEVPSAARPLGQSAMGLISVQATETVLFPGLSTEQHVAATEDRDPWGKVGAGYQLPPWAPQAVILSGALKPGEA